MKKLVLLLALIILFFCGPLWAMKITTKDGREFTGFILIIRNEAGKDTLAEEVNWKKELAGLGFTKVRDAWYSTDEKQGGKFVFILETSPGEIKSIKRAEIKVVDFEEPYDSLFLSYRLQIKEIRDLRSRVRALADELARERHLRATKSQKPTISKKLPIVKKSKPKEQQSLTEEEKEKQCEKEAGPKPVNSPWDAAVEPVVKYLKDTLNDPDSLKFTEWSPVFQSEILVKKVWLKCWGVRAKYRAKNVFGGYVGKHQVFYIRHNKVIKVIDW